MNPCHTAPMPPAPVGMTLAESAARLGACRFVEARRFEVLGGWVPTVPEADAKLLFARHSVHHGWHAELLAGCLPATKDHDPERSTAPARPGVAALLDELAGLTGTLDRLVAVYQVLGPEQISTYDRFLDATNPATDAAARRVVRIVVQDQVDQVTEGLALVETFAARIDGGADVVAAARERFAGGLAAVGGLTT
jgi:hypothetical protein